MKSKVELIYVVCGAAFIGAFVFGVGYMFVQIYKQDNTTTTTQDLQSQTSSTTDDQNQTVNQQSMYKELIKEDTVVGSGKEAVAGNTIVVNYTGKLLDGTIFDSSLNEGREPFEFQLGAGQVIAGWDQGFDGMKEGGKRTLKIPAALAYGDRGAGGVIPPGADLIFDVELLQVK